MSHDLPDGVFIPDRPLDTILRTLPFNERMRIATSVRDCCGVTLEVHPDETLAELIDEIVARSGDA